MTDDKLRAALDRDDLYRRIHAIPGLTHYGKAEQCFPITDAVLAALAASATDEGPDFCPDCGNVPGSQRWNRVHRPAVPALDVLPQLHLSGAQIGQAAESDVIPAGFDADAFAVDYDEYEVFVRLNDVLAALSPKEPTE